METLLTSSHSTTPRQGLCHFSPDRKHRYTLFRDLISPDSDFKLRSGYCMFVGLNPSTADESQNDPTVTRCIHYAQKWGFKQFVMANIFAYRATQPTDMKTYPDPVGSNNDFWLRRLAKDAGLVLCAWGNHGDYLNRGQEVKNLLADITTLHCLKVTKLGHPVHPLYQRADLQPQILSVNP